MKQRKLFLILSTFTLALAGVGAFVASNTDIKDLMVARADKIYTMTLDASNKVVADAYLPQLVTKQVGTVVVNNLLAKTSTSGYAKLAPHGAIYNYVAQGNYNGRVTGIQSMKVVYSGSGLQLSVSRDLSGKIFTEKMNVTSNTEIDLSAIAPSYFYFTNGDSEIDITSIAVKYSCTERNFLNVAQLGKRYTGKIGDTIFSATINGTNIEVRTLNMAENQVFNGTVSVEGNQVKAALNVGNLYFNVNEGRNTLTLDSNKGAGSNFSGLVFNEVFKVDDFENFASTGIGYDNSHANFNNMTGLRGNYHADYYSQQSSTKSLFGDKNWQIMGNDTWLYLDSTGGHNGSKAAQFRSSSNGLRYVNFESLYHVPKTMGKGTKFSFWAHGALNQNRDGNSSIDATVKVRLFYVNPVTGVGDNTGDATSVVIPAGSDWSQYTIDLDTSKEFYGYSFYCNTSSAVYVPIDDIEIMTENPYAKYEAPVLGGGLSYPEGTFMAEVSGYKLVIAIGNETNSLVSVKISTADANATGITYNKNTKAFSITTTGKVGGYTVGTITGTYDAQNDQLVDVDCSGQIGMAVSDVTLTRPQMLLDCDGTTAQLQAAFKRRYRSKGASKWSEDSSNSDRIQANTSTFVAGNGMSIRPCGNSFDAYGFTLQNDLSTAVSAGTVEFWVYNPCDYDITFRGYYYTSKSFGTNGQIGFASADKAKAHSWTYVSRGFTRSNIYNFTITVWTADQTSSATSMSARLVFDNILLY